MTHLNKLGIGLSLFCGFFLFTLVVAVLWLKKKKKKKKKRSFSTENEDEEEKRNRAKWSLSLLCWRRPSSVHNSSSSRDPDGSGGETHDPELGSGKDSIFKEESVESELMRVHNLSGPPRFLFTIKEETREDLEAESAKSRHVSLGDLLMVVDSPLASPLGPYSHHGINPLFESSVSETEDVTKPSSSPPPKFKFLRDAEEKLSRKVRAEKMVCGSFATKSNQSSSSQVMPLVSSPSSIVH